MGDQIRKIVNVFVNALNKYRFFNNATPARDYVGGRLQKMFNNTQVVITSKCSAVSEQQRNEVAVIQDAKTAPPDKAPPLPKHVVQWWQWYKELTGLDLVEVCGQRVNDSQNKLFKIQEDRRELNKQAKILNDKIRDTYGDLLHMQRDDPRYVQLIIIENKGLQEQRKIIAELELIEREEKDQFTLLTTAIKEYHDSQVLNAQKFKYLSLLASALIAIMSLITTMKLHRNKETDVNDVIATAHKKVEDSFNAKYNQILEKLEKYKIVEKKPEDVKAKFLSFIKNYSIIIGVVGFCLLKTVGL